MFKKTTQLILITLSITLISSKTAEEFLSCVRSQLGKPYVWGATGPNSFDCSGLAYYCFDYKIPRSTYTQITGGQPGDGSPGDLVYFGAGPDHVGICVGDGVMIHAPTTGQVVSYQNYRDNSYYQARFKGYRRYWSGSGANILDVYFYKNKYTDLKSFSDNDAINHWNTYGKKEGRIPCLYYNPEFYANNNADLKKAFGNNWQSLYDHFISNGIKEFRNSSPIYNGDFYRKKYSDLAKFDGQSLINHFMQYGIKEGRQASSNFDVSSYKNKNKDLVSAYGNDLKQYYYHYLLFGIAEGRQK